MPLILIDFLSVPLEIKDLCSCRRMDSITRSVGVMKDLIAMLGIMDSFDLLDTQLKTFDTGNDGRSLRMVSTLRNIRYTSWNSFDLYTGE